MRYLIFILLLISGSLSASDPEINYIESSDINIRQSGAWLHPAAYPSRLDEGVSRETYPYLYHILDRVMNAKNPEDVIRRINNKQWDGVGMLTQGSYITSVPGLTFTPYCFGLSSGEQLDYIKCSHLETEQKLSSFLLSFEDRSGNIRWLAIYHICGNLGECHPYNVPLAKKSDDINTVPIPGVLPLIIAGLLGLGIRKLYKG